MKNLVNIDTACYYSSTSATIVVLALCPIELQYVHNLSVTRPLLSESSFAEGGGGDVDETYSKGYAVQRQRQEQLNETG